LPLAIRGGLLLLVVAAVLHTLDRQGEFVSRTDFLWKAKLKVEQEEVETMRGINKVRKKFYLHPERVTSCSDELFM
jgi:adenylate cyclase 2